MLVNRMPRVEIHGMAVQVLAPDAVLDQIVRAIVGCCRPRRVVLYGSRARGDARPDSDYDFWIEIDPGLSIMDAERGIRDAVRDVPVSVGIQVGTAESFTTRRTDVGTLEYQIARDGTVLYAGGEYVRRAVPRPPRVREQGRGVPPSVREWLERAAADLSVARQLIDVPEPSWPAVAFHAHEAAEKFLKSAIICTGAPPKRTHDLPHLVAACPTDIQASDAVRDACAVLNDSWEHARYPSSVKLSRSQAEIAVRAAAAVGEVVRAHIDRAEGDTTSAARVSG